MPKLQRQTVNEVYAERDRLKLINADLLAALEGLLVDIAAGYDYKDIDTSAAHAAILKAHPQATSSYLNRPKWTVEQAVRDSEGKS